MKRYALPLGFLLFGALATLDAQIAYVDGTSSGTTANSGVLAKATAVNLNSVADTAIAITAAKYSLTKVLVTNCSATPVLAQIAIYTAATAGGTNLVAATTITALTSATKFSALTLAVNTDTRSESTLYARNMVVQGTALTCDVYLVGDVLN